MKIKYTILLTTILSPCLALSAPDHSSFAATSHSHWSGYLGLGGGTTSFFNKVNTAGLGRIQYGAPSITGTIFGGTSYLFTNGLKFSAEIFNTFTYAKYTNNAFQPPYTAKLRYTYGARFLPGYRLNSGLGFHALVGYVRANIKSYADPDTQPSQISRNFNGYQLGFGASYEGEHHLGLRGDLIYSKYKHQNFSMSNSDIDNNPSSLDALASIFYSFG